MPGYLVLTEKQSISETPIPVLAGPGPAELGLPGETCGLDEDYSGHSYDFPPIAGIRRVGGISVR
jgi:hypothetical protein